MTTTPTHVLNDYPAYKAALTEVKKVGAARCSDKALMAGFCEDNIQILIGAASPVLVWEGAQRKGLTTLQLNEMCIKTPKNVHELMWYDD